jgi:cupin fold WbuC family metalloprotein
LTAIYFLPQAIVEVGTAELDQLREAARTSPSGRARYCFHEDATSVVHDMLIAFAGRSEVRPHRHLRKSETLHAVEGNFDVVVFDERGHELRRIRMGPAGGDRTLMYRMPPGVWHTVVPLEDMVVLHEVTQGPFVPEETEFAPWR